MLRLILASASGAGLLLPASWSAAPRLPAMWARQVLIRTGSGAVAGLADTSVAPAAYPAGSQTKAGGERISLLLSPAYGYVSLASAECGARSLDL